MKKHKKGKILRIKQGYNPNSSSMGSIVFAFPVIFLVVNAVLGTIAGVFFTIFLRKKKDKK